MYTDGEEEFGTEQTGHLTQGEPRPNLKDLMLKKMMMINSTDQ